MCYESWSQRKQVTDALEKSRKEAEEMIEKAKGAKGPRRPKEPERAPAVEREEATT